MDKDAGKKTAALMTDGFSECGTRYLFRNLHRIDCADFDLSNDWMRLQMDHRGRVIENGFMQPNMTKYAENLRCFYVRDDESGKIWSVPYEPCRVEPDEFLFSIGRNDLQWKITHNGIQIDLRVMIPRNDNIELWTLTATNVSKKPRKLSLYSFLPTGKLGFLAQRAVYDKALQGMALDYFPYYVRYEDYYKVRELRNQVVCASDVKPVAWELCIDDFIGDGSDAVPEQLSKPRLASPTHEWENANERNAGIFQYPMSLAPGKSKTINFMFGPAMDRAEMMRLKRKYLSPGGIDKALKECERFLEQNAPQVRIETPDVEFNHFINHWQSRRSLTIIRAMRHYLAPQGRNAIQDGMGASYVCPETSRKWFLKMWAHQHTNGWLPHGMPFADGVVQPIINTIPHKDINSWGPSALHFYVAETGDFSILDEQVPFGDDPSKTASLYTHICMGLDWLLKDRTPRGLCRIGQGDWNDPLNMAGLKEKGESIWLSEALVLALNTWAEIADYRGEKKTATRYRREAQTLKTRINKYAWNGKWYTRGFDDRAEPFGVPSRKEGKIFINAQSWAIIAGVSDVKQTATCIGAVEKHLDTPAGPMTLAPPFTKMDENIGKLTQKIPGWNENGSVYCHATAFYSYALYVAGEADKGFKVLRSLLPGGGKNTIERCNQLPLYIPNFYRGTAAGRKAGLSSHSPNSGTAAWYYRTAIAMLLGVRADLDALVIDPHLPSHWPGAKVWRRWRGTEFNIEIRKAEKNEKPRVEFDGKVIEGNRVPVQKTGTKHTVLVVK